jgi:hypothetical protein
VRVNFHFSLIFIISFSIYASGDAKLSDTEFFKTLSYNCDFKDRARQIEFIGVDGCLSTNLLPRPGDTDIILTFFNNNMIELDKIKQGFTSSPSKTMKDKKRMLLSKVLYYGQALEMLNVLQRYAGFYGMVSDAKVLNQMKDDDKIQSQYEQYAFREYNKMAGKLEKFVDELRNEIYSSRPHNLFVDEFDIDNDNSLGECLEIKDECFTSLLKEFPQARDCFNKSSKDFNGRTNLLFEGLSDNTETSVLSNGLYGVKKALLSTLSGVYLYKGRKMTESMNEELLKDLKPGDIAATGKDGPLTNALLGGQWTHGVMYVGDKKQWKKNFDKDEKTKNYYKNQCEKFRLKCDNFTGWLEKRYPKKYKEFSTNPNFNVIEALSDGVIFSEGKKSLRTNRLVTVKPTSLTELERAQVVESAFSTVGQDYNFNFNARSNFSRVCTGITAILAEKVKDKNGNPVVFRQSQILGDMPIGEATNILQAARDYPEAFKIGHYADVRKNRTQFLSTENVPLN